MSFFGFKLMILTMDDHSQQVITWGQCRNNKYTPRAGPQPGRQPCERIEYGMNHKLRIRFEVLERI